MSLILPFPWLAGANRCAAEENVRDIVTQTDIPMTTGHYLRSMKQLTNQWTPTNYREERRQRLYLKDIDCPPEWQDELRKVIPPNLFYMNENIENRACKRQINGMDMFQEPSTAAPAGDLMSSLPEQMRAQNLMCYIGHEGTFTPAHREMCASLGQNIMIDASGSANGEKPGSSIWFMTETKDREVVKEYFLSMLGHDIEIEKHFAQINAWKKAGFPVYVVEQKVGDFILVPPLAPHQVWNRGTRTIKVAWNRTTVETLGMALHEALPKARLVCRDEQYKNKAIIFYTLKKYYNEMLEAEKTTDIGLLGLGQDLMKNSPRTRQLAADFKALFRLFTEILVDEMFATKEKDVEYIEFDSCITCSYCRANIFNRFLTCKHCIRELVNGEQDTYDVCMECYAMGRSCLCVSNLSWCEQWRWPELVSYYEDWRSLIIKNDGFIDFDTSPLPLELERRKSGKKSLGQICQEQLKQRPFKDITKAEPLEPEISEPEVDDNGNPKKKPKRKKKHGDVYRCHVCNHKDYTYRLAFCSNPGCADAYCYGSLYRAFDMMPQDVIQNERWLCPKCLNICNCGYCRRVGNGNPYTPKNTFLGHDTRAIADDRSVEMLVDFRVHNLSWLKNVGDDSRNVSSKRIQRLQQAAETEKAKEAELDNTVTTLLDRELAETLEAAIRQEEEFGGQNGTANDANGAAQEPERAAVADMSVSQDQSDYPDPSMLGHERIGIGYYEQDDSPDKILFDPYQAPTAEAMVVDDEPEVSEYFKKQLRLAKRRARNEEDNDPDFAAPRTNRKRTKTDDYNEPDGQQEALDNMDPALFADETMVDAPAESDSSAEPEFRGNTAANGDAAEESAEHRPYSPNRPALRHARPKASYLDALHREEEFDEIFVPNPKRPTESAAPFNPDSANKDPLDLASAAILAMTGSATSTPQDQAPAPAADRQKKKPGRKPGRLPGRPPGRPPLNRPVGDVGITGTGKRRGRPPDSARNSLNVAPEKTAEDNESGTTDLDDQLARQLEGFNDDGEVIEQGVSSTPVHPALQANAPKRRGRPPRSSMPQPATAPVAAGSGSPFMSMAERMRLKGKKIKITARKSEPGSIISNPVDEASLATTEIPTKDTAPKATWKAAPNTAPKKRGRPPKQPPQAAAESDDDGDFNPDAEELEVLSEPPFPSPSASRHNAASFSRSSASPTPPPAPTPKRAVPPPSASAQEPAAGPDLAPEITAPSSPGPTTSYSSSPPSPSPALSPTRLHSPTPSLSPSPSPPPTARAPTGPTIVRLMSSDEESGTDYGSASESEASESDKASESGKATGGTDKAIDSSGSDSDSDSDDEDIPARVKDPARGSGLARRGFGGGFRGRGGGGRGRARRGVS